MAETAGLSNKAVKMGLGDGLKRLRCAGTHMLATSRSPQGVAIRYNPESRERR